MKRILLFCLSLCAVIAVSAQTYKNGTWYSLYDESEHEMSTISSYTADNIFAPTAKKLQFNWNYSKVDLTGWFPSNTTKIYESADGGSNTTQIGSLTDKTWNTEHSENQNISANINWLKWDRAIGNTHKVTLYNIKVALAQHILLADGTYGTTTKSYNFGEIDALSTSEAYTIALRSFLSAGDITVHSSDPEIFRLGSADNTGDITYAVGANACASANGTANAASGGTLGKIGNYAVAVYFTPKEGKEYSAEITFSDGVSTAKVTVSGVGRKLAQTITWEPETPVLSDATITAAVASSGLEVAYTFEPEGIIAVENGVLTIVGEGVATVTASQAGNTVYEAAEPVVRTITVFPAVTRSEYSAVICEGETYSDEHFAALTEKGLYYDTIPNVYGGDSIICLSLTVNPTYLIEESNSVYEGEAGTWEGINLNELTVGDTTLIVRYAAVTGCDSTHVLHLSVLRRTYGEYQASFCEGDSVEFAGKWYSAATVEDVIVPEKNIYGGDSIVTFTAIVMPNYLITEDTTIDMIESLTWREKEYGLFAPGFYTLYDSLKSANGCDSVYALELTVNEAPATYGVDTIYICGRGEIAFYDDVPYSKPSKTPITVTLSTPNHFGGDSIVELWVLASNKYDMSFSKTIDEGTAEEWQGIDLSVLPAGDTTLVVVYTTIHGCDSTYTLYLTVKAVQQTPTAIENADGVENKPYKFFRNGQMYIRKNGQVYNLQGIKVEED